MALDKNPPSENIQREQKLAITIGYGEILSINLNEEPLSIRNTSADSKINPAKTRKNQGINVRVDLLKSMKRIALEENRKLYQVMEQAFEEYLDRYHQGKNI